MSYLYHLSIVALAVIFHFSDAFLENVHAAESSAAVAKSNNRIKVGLDSSEEMRDFCINLSNQAYDRCCSLGSGCDDRAFEKRCNGESNSIHEQCLTTAHRSAAEFN